MVMVFKRIFYNIQMHFTIQLRGETGRQLVVLYFKGIKGSVGYVVIEFGAKTNVTIVSCQPNISIFVYLHRNTIYVPFMHIFRDI